MTIVPPDGPVPCDLAVVGEAPSHAEVAEGRSFVGPSGRILWPIEQGDLGLIETVADRPRHTCYVTNVCKTQMPDAEWWKLSMGQRDAYAKALVNELKVVQPRLVLAFGRRAAVALVPGFNTMPADHGKPVLGTTGKYVVMALWHPAAYLRGNAEALGAIAADLAKVPTLLMDGLVELMQPAPVLVVEWPLAIAFLAFDGERKSGKCTYCGGAGIAAYNGEGLAWKLCKPHAVRLAEWAVTNMAAMLEHRDVAVAQATTARQERTATRMEAQLREGADRLYGQRAVPAK